VKANKVSLLSRRWDRSGRLHRHDRRIFGNTPPKGRRRSPDTSFPSRTGASGLWPVLQHQTRNGPFQGRGENRVTLLDFVGDQQ
jgi:hypothetical protein